jgi:hypothetical protein
MERLNHWLKQAEPLQRKRRRRRRRIIIRGYEMHEVRVVSTHAAPRRNCLPKRFLENRTGSHD